MYTMPALQLNRIPQLIPFATGAPCITFIVPAREKTFTIRSAGTRGGSTYSGREWILECVLHATNTGAHRYFPVRDQNSLHPGNVFAASNEEDSRPATGGAGRSPCSGYRNHIRFFSNRLAGGHRKIQHIPADKIIQREEMSYD
jgi:hypothetical protein